MNWENLFEVPTVGETVGWWLEAENESIFSTKSRNLRIFSGEEVAVNFRVYLRYHETDLGAVELCSMSCLSSHLCATSEANSPQSDPMKTRDC